jgi:hypothetical protein
MSCVILIKGGDYKILPQSECEIAEYPGWVILNTADSLQQAEQLISDDKKRHQPDSY